MLKQKMYYKDSILFLSDLKYLGLIQTISFLQIEFSLAPFFFYQNIDYNVQTNNLHLAKTNQNNMIKMSQTVDITLQPMQ